MAEQSQYQRDTFLHAVDDINMSIARIVERYQSWSEFVGFVQRMKAHEEQHNDGSARSLAKQAFIRELEIYTILKDSRLVKSQIDEKVKALLLEIEALRDEAQQKAR